MRNLLLILVTIFLFVPELFSLDTSKSAKLIEKTTGITKEDFLRSSAKKEISLFDAFVIAVQKNETPLIEGEYLIQSREKKMQALGNFLPRLSLKAQKYFPDNGPGTSSTSRTGVNLYLRQNFFTGLTEWSAFRRLKYESKMRQYRLQYQLEQLLLDISYGYYTILQKEKSLENQKQILELYGGVAHELQRRVAVGRSRRSELLRTYTQIQKLKAGIISLEQELSQIRLEFSTITGISSEVKLLPEILSSDVKFNLSGINKIIPNRSLVQASVEDVRIAKSLLQEAYGRFLPSAYFEFTYKLYQQEKTGRDYYSALGAELPLFSGGTTFFRIRETRSILRQTELGLSRVKKLSRQEITDAWESWESSTKEIVAYKEARDLSEKNYRTILKEYRLNLSTILDVFSSLSDLQKDRDEYQRALLQHALNRIRLGVATNEFTGKGILSIGKDVWKPLQEK